MAVWLLCGAMAATMAMGAVPASSASALPAAATAAYSVAAALPVSLPVAHVKTGIEGALRLGWWRATLPKPLVDWSTAFKSDDDVAFTTAAPTPPNILIMVSDDLGHGDVPWTAIGRQSQLQMPHLVALKASGVTLTQHYVQPSCAPTRSSLMTGRYSNHVGTQNGGWHNTDAAGLAVDEVLLAQNMQDDCGYTTAIFGKWHLGYYSHAHLPTSRGFQLQEGYYNAEIHYFNHSKDGGYDWNVQCQPNFTMNGTFSDILLRNAATDFIQTQAAITGKDKKPWFLYLPLQAVHAPLEVPARYIALYPTSQKITERTKHAMLSAMDEAIGSILGTLAAAGSETAENTITIWTSDNGSPSGNSPTGYDSKNKFGGSNLPLRGYKHTLYEGGLRVPTIVSSPLLPAALRNTTNNNLYHITDWLPTLVKLGGGEALRNKPLDGKDIWPSILNPTAPPPRTELFHCYVSEGPKTSMKGPWGALRMGSFKLLVEQDGKTLSLYNITGKDQDDERRDLAGEPAFASQLDMMWARLQKLKAAGSPPWAQNATCQPRVDAGGDGVKHGSIVDVDGHATFGPTCG